jgi:ABC-type antimicrobial peptide transport system permease subunit
LGKGLVVFQFTLSVCLIISSLVYYQQMSFMRTKDLGYNPDNIIRIDIPPRRETQSIYTQFKNELSQEPGIKQLSLEANMDGDYKMMVNDRTVKGSYRLVEESYLPMLEIPLKEGRNFSSAFGTDKTNAAIVNEAFVNAAGLKNPIGQSIHTNDWFVNRELVIVGVVKNYHYGSLKQTIQPLVIAMGDQSQGTVLVKINKARNKEALAALERIYRKAIPGSQYSYTFWDELNAKEFDQEQRWLQIIQVATGLSILICCLGLFGLSNLATRQRMKEIGVRKVLGASVAGIAALLSKDFLKLVIIGFVIASPLAWWIMNNWLQGFAYRITIGWWIFLLAAVLTITLALATVSIQTIKAAMANPVKSLHTE